MNEMNQCLMDIEKQAILVSSELMALKLMIRRLRGRDAQLLETHYNRRFRNYCIRADATVEDAP